MEYILIILGILATMIAGPVFIVKIRKNEKEIQSRKKRKEEQEKAAIKKAKIERDAELKKKTEAENQLREKESLIEKLDQISNLFNNNVYSEEEFSIKKKDTLQKLTLVKVDDVEDLLLELIPLKDRGVLTKDELLEIQNILKNRSIK